ncbi:hypothetical protein [Luteolibacter soli]|uniref:Lipopolysaccharide biosynthesis protein n=1 Tax=Luteolibacter soli TaxID=3135280 RepID=A0ABU9ARJ4_9BACT
MEGLATRRWNPGFVAMRWRRLFWMLPLLGVVMGVAWFLFQQFRETSVPGSIAYFSGKTSSAGNEEVAREGMEFMTSERVLKRAANRVERSETWGVSADVDVIRRQQKVEIDATMGMPTLKMTVTGRGEKAARETWMAIYDAAWAIAVEEQRVSDQVELDSAKGKVSRLEAEVASLEPGSPDGKRGVKAVLSELDHARETQKRLEMGQMCSTSFFERVALISPPHPATPAVPFGRLGMLGLHGAGGFGVGLFGAVFLAYLLEFLKPRRVVPVAGLGF